jgi:hypothetical protein
MKFRSNTKVIIDNSDNKLSIIIEPIIDRASRCWVQYSINIDNTFNEIKKVLNTSDNKIIILYGVFKKLFCINYVSKLNYERKMTYDDYMKDLDFMKDEILKCKNAIIKYKHIGNDNMVTRYENLINNEQHKMFQVNTKDEFDSYLDYIDSLIVKNEKNKMEQLSINIKSVWNE